MSFAERLNSESIYDTWEVASDLAARRSEFASRR